MIVRTWRARASRANELQYTETVRRIVLPELGSVPGYLGAHFLKKIDGERLEILVMTYWESMETIEALTPSADVRTAYVPPEIVEILDSFDATADHYGVMVEDLKR